MSAAVTRFRRLLSWVLRTLRALPEQRRVDEEKERRISEMRRKVASLLPDFKSGFDGSET